METFDIDNINGTSGNQNSSSDPILTIEKTVPNGQKLLETIDMKHAVVSFKMFQCSFCLAKDSEQNFWTLTKAQMHIEDIHKVPIQTQNVMIESGNLKIPQKSMVIQ